MDRGVFQLDFFDIQFIIKKIIPVADVFDNQFFHFKKSVRRSGILVLNFDFDVFEGDVAIEHIDG